MGQALRVFAGEHCSVAEEIYGSGGGISVKAGRGQDRSRLFALDRRDCGARMFRCGKKYRYGFFPIAGEITY